MKILPSYPSIEDCVSPKPLDLEILRNEVVTGVSYAPSFGKREDLQQQICMLEQEFSGQLRLKLLHAIFPSSTKFPRNTADLLGVTLSYQ